jgi:hypothetical protein
MRAYVSWIGLPFVAYFLSYLWLGDAIWAVPAVLGLAPAGLLAVFDESYRTHREPGSSVFFHLIFWSLLLFGVINAKNARMPLAVLRSVFTTLVLMLALTMYGCARYYHAPSPLFPY